MNNDNNKHKLSRRQFLGQASCAAVGSSALFSSILNLGMTSRLAADVPASVGDYKAMVCLFLGGGNDSFNMLIPYDEYSEYAATRGDIALPQGDLANTIITGQGKQFAIHPGMPELKTLYDGGELAFVSNVGTLVQPTTLSDYNNGIALPYGLFSHADQIQQWQTSVPNSRSRIGWGGRTADLLHSLNDNANISMNISLNGNNVFQTGQDVFPYGIADNGATKLDGYGENGVMNVARTSAVDSILGQTYADLFNETFSKTTKGARDVATEFQNATSGIALNTSFPNTGVGRDLEMVAKTIAAQATLGFKRQTFFVFLGGWDHHDETVETQAEMLPVISQAVKAFRDAIKNELNMWNNVTLFQASDFARTLTSNSKGTDHAWGSNVFVTGGAVTGGDIYGSYPSLNLTGNSLDTGRGRFIPSTSVDEFNAELALWFGVPESCLPDVLPNINNFYNGGGSPVGFMG